MKKWNDEELRIAYEDGHKFFDFADLQEFLLGRRQPLYKVPFKKKRNYKRNITETKKTKSIE